MQKEKYLPIGTVVKLKNGEKNLMIVGFCPVVPDSNEIVDYNGCMYPEGILSSDLSFLFNHEQIEEIVYMGLINEEEIEFKKEVEAFMSDKEFLQEKLNKVSNEEIVEDNSAKQPIEIPIMQQAAPMVDLSDVSQMVETLDINNQN